MIVRFLYTVAIVSMLAFAFSAETRAEENKSPADKEPTAETKNYSPAKPKPLSEVAHKGLKYLINQQDSSGGWGQGGGWRQSGKGGGRVTDTQTVDKPDVANTCMATLSLIRSGSTPSKGPYAKNIVKGAEFICSQIEESDDKSLWITNIRDTQVQVKIGRYVDTFLAAMVLSELKGTMPDSRGESRVVAALNKVVAKIEKNQKADGTFDGNKGWASVLSQGLAGKALNRARQAGVKVREDSLKRDFSQTVAQLDKKTGDFKASAAGGDTRDLGKSLSKIKSVASAKPSDAGVDIYRSSANASRLQDLVNTNAIVEKEAKEVLANKDASSGEKKQAQQKLKQVKEVAKANQAAVGGIVRKIDDKNFVAGFGNNGGEEYLSFMNISETLCAQGGDQWKKWDDAVSGMIGKHQNEDGSWAGKHCITGRTFCTSAALLTLLADRMPLPLAAKQSQK